MPDHSMDHNYCMSSPRIVQQPGGNHDPRDPPDSPDIADPLPTSIDVNQLTDLVSVEEQVPCIVDLTANDLLLNSALPLTENDVTGTNNNNNVELSYTDIESIGVSDLIETFSNVLSMTDNNVIGINDSAALTNTSTVTNRVPSLKVLARAARGINNAEHSVRTENVMSTNNLDHRKSGNDRKEQSSLSIQGLNSDSSSEFEGFFTD